MEGSYRHPLLAVLPALLRQHLLELLAAASLPCELALCVGDGVALPHRPLLLLRRLCRDLLLQPLAPRLLLVRAGLLTNMTLNRIKIE